jgi:hypothetical protein
MSTYTYVLLALLLHQAIVTPPVHALYSGYGSIRVSNYSTNFDNATITPFTTDQCFNIPNTANAVKVTCPTYEDEAHAALPLLKMYSYTFCSGIPTSITIASYTTVYSSLPDLASKTADQFYYSVLCAGNSSAALPNQMPWQVLSYDQTCTQAVNVYNGSSQSCQLSPTTGGYLDVYCAADGTQQLAMYNAGQCNSSQLISVYETANSWNAARAVIYSSGGDNETCFSVVCQIPGTPASKATLKVTGATSSVAVYALAGCYRMQNATYYFRIQCGGGSIATFSTFTNATVDGQLCHPSQLTGSQTASPAASTPIAVDPANRIGILCHTDRGLSPIAQTYNLQIGTPDECPAKNPFLSVFVGSSSTTGSECFVIRSYYLFAKTMGFSNGVTKVGFYSDYFCTTQITDYYAHNDWSDSCVFFPYFDSVLTSVRLFSGPTAYSSSVMGSSSAVASSSNPIASSSIVGSSSDPIASSSIVASSSNLITSSSIVASSSYPIASSSIVASSSDPIASSSDVASSSVTRFSSSTGVASSSIVASSSYPIASSSIVASSSDPIASSSAPIASSSMVASSSDPIASSSDPVASSSIIASSSDPIASTSVAAGASSSILASSSNPIALTSFSEPAASSSHVVASSSSVRSSSLEPFASSSGLTAASSSTRYQFSSSAVTQETPESSSTLMTDSSSRMVIGSSSSSSPSSLSSSTSSLSSSSLSSSSSLASVNTSNVVIYNGATQGWYKFEAIVGQPAAVAIVVCGSALTLATVSFARVYWLRSLARTDVFRFSPVPADV